MTRLERRDFLRTAAAGGLAAVAGCLDGLAGDGGGVEEAPDGLPAYNRWIPAETVGVGEGVSFSRIDWPWALEAGDDGEPFAAVGVEMGPEDGPADVDPLFGLPVLGYVSTTTAMGFALQPYEFVVDIVEGGDGEVGVSDVVMVGDVFVIGGEFDRGQILDRAEDAGFEFIEERGDFDLYEERTEDESEEDDNDDDGEEDDDSEEIDVTTPAFAASEEGVAVVMQSEQLDDGLDTVEKVVDAVNGDADRLTDANEQAHDAVSRSGHGQIAFGGWETGDLTADTREEDEEGSSGMEFESTEADIDSMVAGLEIDNDAMVASGRITVVFDGEAPSEEEIEEMFGYSVDYRQVERGDDWFAVAGTWRED